MESFKSIPRHVAIIMDGNGRWAKGRGLPKALGHRQGANVANKMTEAAREWGIKVLTLYAFSTENWKRAKDEVGAIFKLLEEFLAREEPKLIRNNVKLSVIGDMSKLPQTTRDTIDKVLTSTFNNSQMTLNLALNYGSRSEITEAVRKIASDVKIGALDIKDISEDTISRCLYTRDMPDPDLLIRTSGESRISNFLLWQISYSEIYISRKLWPDFTRADFKKAIEEYNARQRRYGG